jgi:hypothetical protein
MFCTVAGVFFAVVGVAHLARVILGWNFVFANFSVPVLGSVVAFIVLAYLSFVAFKLSGLLK